jgi:glutathione synthase/RimK-type ligase-like ATP-grasp enzyme
VILIVSHPGDDHAAGVLAELARAGHPAALLDTSRYPRDASLNQGFDGRTWRRTIAVDGRTIDLAACRAAWWRRPQPYTLHEGMTPDVLAFSHSECHEALAGAWAALDCVWVNRPELDAVAHHKPYQLAVATRVGFTVPRTLITNDPGAARQFIEELGVSRTIYKTFLATEACWRETRVLREEELALLDSVAIAPVIFQEYVEAEADIRVTVVGPRLFAAAIRAAPEAYATDYRMDLAGARFTPVELPARTATRIRAFMEALGLMYGALDFRRTAAGDDIFLEINPAGEWRFVEERTRQPITAAMATLLSELDTPRSARKRR